MLATSSPRPIPELPALAPDWAPADDPEGLVPNPSCVGDGAPTLVEPGLVAELRIATADRAGLEAVVDCAPVGLALSPDRARRLARCARHLLREAVAGTGAREVDLTVRAERRAGAPVVYVSVRTVDETEPSPAGRRRDLARREPRRQLVQEKGSALLLARCEGRERRLTLALEMPFEVLADREVPGPTAERVLVADDNPRVRRVARRILERCGFSVAEVPGAIALLAELDPHRAMAPPDWLLVDEGWLKPVDAAGRGLLPALEATMPAERVVVLSSRCAAESAGRRCVAKPFGGAELQSTLATVPAPAR